MQMLSLPVVVGAFCGAVLSGCGDNNNPSPAPTPTPLEDGWNNHFDAFGAGVGAADGSPEREAALDKIMLDYNNDSVVRLFDHSVAGTNEEKLSTYGPNDLPAIRNMFAGLFPALAGCGGEAADDKLQAGVDVDNQGLQVFLVWSCSSASFNRATDTFIFDDAGKIVNQNIVVAKTAGLAASRADALVQFRRLQYTGGATVQESWTNHADAFMAGAAAGGNPARDQTAMDAAVTKIMLDYTEQSIIRTFTFKAQANSVDGDFAEHEGLDKIRDLFTGLFESFSNSTAPNVLQALVVEEKAPQVFLVWDAPDSKYKEATDTFVFSESAPYRIHRQNIALFTPEM